MSSNSSSNKYSRHSLKKMYPNIKFYKIQDDYKTLIKKQLKQEIPNSSTTGKNYTYKDIIKLLLKHSSKIYLIGGYIRDLIGNKGLDKLSDIDIKYTISPDEVNKVLKTLPDIHFERGKFFDKIFYVGDRKDKYCLDLNYLNIDDKFELTSNANCNSLLLDIRTYTIIDLFGEGVHNSKKKIWKKPNSLSHKEWVTTKTKLFWRMLKFSLKGYTIPDVDKIEIYKYVYNQPHKPNIRWFDIWRVLDKKDSKEIAKIIKSDLERLDVKITYAQMIEKLRRNKIKL